jgi:hypothetical protein
VRAASTPALSAAKGLGRSPARFNGFLARLPLQSAGRFHPCINEERALLKSMPDGAVLMGEELVEGRLCAQWHGGDPADQRPAVYGIGTLRRSAKRAGDIYFIVRRRAAVSPARPMASSK